VGFGDVGEVNVDGCLALDEEGVVLEDAHAEGLGREAPGGQVSGQALEDGGDVLAPGTKRLRHLGEDGACDHEHPEDRLVDETLGGPSRGPLYTARATCAISFS